LENLFRELREWACLRPLEAFQTGFYGHQLVCREMSSSKAVKLFGRQHETNYSQEPPRRNLRIQDRNNQVCRQVVAEGFGRQPDQGFLEVQQILEPQAVPSLANQRAGLVDGLLPRRVGYVPVARVWDTPESLLDLLDYKFSFGSAARLIAEILLLRRVPGRSLPRC
jgi:hypothetical protein